MQYAVCCVCISSSMLYRCRFWFVGAASALCCASVHVTRGQNANTLASCENCRRSLCSEHLENDKLIYYYIYRSAQNVLRNFIKQNAKIFAGTSLSNVRIIRVFLLYIFSVFKGLIRKLKLISSVSGT